MAILEPDKETERLLASDHAALDHAFDALARAIDENDSVESFARLDLLWARLGMHIRAEHLCLFPAILDAVAEEHGEEITILDCDTVRDTIAELRSDHDFFMHEMAHAINILRSREVADNEHSNTWQDIVRQTMITIRHRLEAHNAVEEQKVYRWASMLLTGSDQARLAARVRNELENLPPRFRAN